MVPSLKSHDGSSTRMIRQVLNIKALDRSKSKDLLREMQAKPQCHLDRMFETSLSRTHSETKHHLLTLDPFHGKMSRSKLT